MVFERRKYTRYIVQSDTYAAFGSHFTKVGRTKDISIGGLAFEYINHSEEEDQHPFKVSIFLTDNKFFLWNVPCRLIYDLSKDSSSENQESNSLFVQRRCGLQFSHINEDQKLSLEYFFNHHTRGIITSSDYLNNI